VERSIEDGEELEGSLLTPEHANMRLIEAIFEEAFESFLIRGFEKTDLAVIYQLALYERAHWALDGRNLACFDPRVAALLLALCFLAAELPTTKSLQAIALKLLTHGMGTLGGDKAICGCRCKFCGCRIDEGRRKVVEKAIVSGYTLEGLIKRFDVRELRGAHLTDSHLARLLGLKEIDLSTIKKLLCEKYDIALKRLRTALERYDKDKVGGV